MTDLESTKALLDRLEVGYTVRENAATNLVTIDITEGNEKVVGHCDFFALFKFNSDGSFVEIMIGE